MQEYQETRSVAEQTVQIDDRQQQPAVSSYAWYVLAVLGIVYLMNFLDRTLIYILFPPIKREMALSDLQLALLGTTSFALFYTALGIPFGRLADRAVRKTMVAVGLVIWSVFSGLTGFATNFWMMFLCRVMVGVGEATLGPAALSLLSDYFPKQMRATAQSIFTAGIPLGAAAAFFLGGWIADLLGWRWAFYLLSFPGVVLAGLVWFIKEPPRGVTDTITTDNAPRDWRVLPKIPTLYFHTLGYAAAAIAANSLSIWVPTLLNRTQGMTLTSIGLMAGFSMLFAGGVSTGFGGVIADWFRQRSNGGRMKFTALAMVICVPLWLTFLLSGNQVVMVICYALLTGAGLLWVGPAAADMHDIVGPNLRGVGIGVYYFVVNIIGYGIAPPLIGNISDALGASTDPTQMSVALMLCPAACALSAVLLWLGSKRLDNAV